MSVIMYRLKKGGRAAVILPDGFLFGVDQTKKNIRKKLIEEFNLHTIIRLPASVFAPYTPQTTNLLFFDNTTSTEGVWFYRLDMPEGYKHFSKTKSMKVEHFTPVIEWWKNRGDIQDELGEDRTIESWKAKYVLSEEIRSNGYLLNYCGYPTEEIIVLSPQETIKTFIEKRNSINEQLDSKLNELLSLLEVE